jgi:ArsR family metal-binding transcriptional regulator
MYEDEQYTDWKVFIYTYEGWVYKHLYGDGVVRMECYHDSNELAQSILDEKDWICGEGQYE